MTRNDDNHTLLQWAMEKELEAHNEAHTWFDENGNEPLGVRECAEQLQREKDFHEMAEKIQNMQANQWPRARKEKPGV